MCVQTNRLFIMYFSLDSDCGRAMGELLLDPLRSAPRYTFAHMHWLHKQRALSFAALLRLHRVSSCSFRFLLS